LLAEFTYYNEQRDGLGFEFLSAVEAAINDIAAWPDSWPPFPEWDRIPVMRTRRVQGFPYRVIYLVDGEVVVIFAYAHDRRRPGYWRERIEPY